MKNKEENGLAGVDMIIAIVALMIFSTLIVALMYNNILENVKLKKETLAMIYITEIFENVGIESYQNLKVGEYEDITNIFYDENIRNLIPQDIEDSYKINLTITNQFESTEDIIKKISVTLIYNINDNEYICSMERMKIKE